MVSSTPVYWVIVTSLFFICSQAAPAVLLITKSPQVKESTRKIFNWRLALAGGLAGGWANAIMYPIDTIKTMRQTDSKGIKSSMAAFKTLQKLGLSKIYSGFIPAVAGAIPSSAIYFGSYETMKSYLLIKFENSTHVNRPAVHMLAAASGNIASSIVFVPKDAVKQQLQAIKTGLIKFNGVQVQSTAALSKISTREVCKSIYKTKGLKGFYPSYKATLMRNIPSAAIRFALYEELKILIHEHVATKYSSLGYVLAGTVSSACSSVFATPFDVVKTRLATGVLPAGSPVLRSIYNIGQTEGVAGLYAGLHARLLWSGLFGGIGFACFEACKKVLVEEFPDKREEQEH